MPDTPPGITRNDVVRLLALAAGGDQRTVSAEDVTLWHQIARDQRWTFRAAQRVIVEHYSTGADKPRISPAAISDRLRVLRGRAAESFDAPAIPDQLPRQDYPRWLRRQLAGHVDEVLERWAETGGPIPEAKPIEAPARYGGLAELVAAAPAEHRAELTAGARSAGRAPRPRSGPAASTRGAHLDTHRMAAARAELDAARPRESAERSEPAGESS